MQLTYPKAPSNGVMALRPALQAALQTQSFGFAAAAPSKIRLSNGYRGYTLGLEDLSNGKGLKSAKVGDWHHLVFADSVLSPTRDWPTNTGKSNFPRSTTERLQRGRWVR